VPSRASRVTKRMVVAMLTTALITSAGAQVAQATTNPQAGVHVDPGSPAGKEYQFPVAGARGETAGGGQQSSSGNPPLFGVGVSPAAAATGSTDQTNPNRGTASATNGGARSGPHAASSAASSAAVGPSSAEGSPALATTGSAGAGGSGWIPLAVGGLLVLVLGGGGGLMLRQRVLRG
jgi:hypothetical protein